jgi:hypothetical protein
MDVFKLAFETMIVGLLACTWLSVAIDLLFPTFFPWLIRSIGGKNENLIGLALLSLAYCFGSAIMPIADQLLNDEHWPLPEYAIRCWVSMEENDRLKDISEDTELLPNYKSTEDFEVCRCSYWDIFFKKDQDKKSQKVQKVLDIPPTWEEFKRRRNSVDDDINRDELLTLFLLYENKVLSQGADKTEFFRQLRERIVVLRGAVISGTILFLLCFFRAIARCDTEKFKWKVVDKAWIRTVLGTLLALAFALFSVHNALEDLQHPDIFDIPILEVLLGLTSVFGGYWVLKGVPPRSFLNMRSVLLTAFVTVFAYGGWMWSEVIYDQQIITAFSVLQKGS